MEQNAVRPRALVAMLALAGIVGTCTAALAGGTPASGSLAPPATVTGRLLTSPPGTLPPGAPVRASDLHKRVFVDARHGFALDGAGQATYAAVTNNGGRSWHTGGPALVLHAAQGPLEVTEIGAVSRRLFFADGAEATDVTRDGGRHWYRAVLPGGVVAVLERGRGLAAVVESGETSPTSNWVYVTTDGGVHWTYEPQL